MKLLTLPLSALIFSLLLIGSAAGSPVPARIVYHIDFEQPNRQTTALRNIANQIAALDGKPFDLRVVLHGRGVSLLTVPDAILRTSRLTYANANPDTAQTLRALRQQGVTFWVCRNTLERYGLSQADLLPAAGAHLIPSGIAELARLQSQGYAYVKP